MKADSFPIRTADHCGGHKKTGKFRLKLAGFVFGDRFTGKIYHVPARISY